MCKIKHILESNRLILTWRGPNDSHGRYAVAELQHIGETFVFSYLKDSKDFLEAQKIGFNGFSAFNNFELIYTENVLDVFKSRIPPRSRDDFKLYLEQIGLDPEAVISDFALLSYSGAKLATDSFELVDPLDNLDNLNAPCELLLELAGVRHYVKDCSIFKADDSVQLLEEPENPYDYNAVVAMCRGMKIGYINKMQCEAIKHGLKSYLFFAHINKINGTEERPRILICVKVNLKTK